MQILRNPLRALTNPTNTVTEIALFKVDGKRREDATNVWSAPRLQGNSLVEKTSLRNGIRSLGGHQALDALRF
jgi:hypothetical protein